MFLYICEGSGWIEVKEPYKMQACSDVGNPQNKLNNTLYAGMNLRKPL